MSDAETALLPCPFCGGPAVLTMFTDTDWYGHWGVACRDENDTCAANPWVVAGRDDAAADKKRATEMWNRRAPRGLDAQTVERVAHILCASFNGEQCEKCSLASKGPRGGVRGCIHDATAASQAAIRALLETKEVR